jgi:hypothetical protein
MKPYEIRLEEFDPTNSIDNPAGGIARFSGSKYKLWINTANSTYWVRKSPRHNNWR